MSRWIILIIPLICLLLLTGNCSCKKSGASVSKCKHDPQQADQADSAIAELTQKMANLQAELKELKKEKAPDTKADAPNLDEVNAQPYCCKAWQKVVEQFSETLQKYEKKIEDLTKQLTQANATATQAKEELELAKQKFAQMQKKANVQEANAAKEAIEKAIKKAEVAEKNLKETVKQAQEAVGNSQKAVEEFPLYKKLQEQVTDLSEHLKKTNITVGINETRIRGIDEFVTLIKNTLKEVTGRLVELTEIDPKKVTEELKALAEKVRELEAKIKELEENKGSFAFFSKK